MITITRDKIYRSPFSLKNTQSSSTTVKEIEPDDIINYLGEGVEFGENLTFGRVFELIVLHKKFLNILFSSDMRRLKIEDFIEDYEREYEIKEIKQEYKLRLMWICDVYDYDGIIDYIDYVAFDAFGKMNKEVDESDYGISVAYSSLGELKKSLIFVDNKFDIQDAKSFENEIGAIFKASYRAITLYEAFCSILREISLYGKPEDRDAQRREMERKKRDIDLWIEEGTLEDNTKSWEDVEKELDDIISETEEKESGETFWNMLYPELKVIEQTEEEMRNEAIEDAMIELSETSDLTLEQQMENAAADDDYERAGRIKKLIEKRDDKKN